MFFIIFILKRISKICGFILGFSIALQGCTHIERSNQGKEDLDKINKGLKDYSTLNHKQQADLRENVIRVVQEQRELFAKKIDDAGSNLKELNLIVGTTGAGKSTLFNFLNGYPMKIVEVKGSARIEIDNSKLSPEQCSRAAHIGHENISETTIPNFSKSPTSDTIYVDCAGEFDNKDILQSIINSYFKCDLAKGAEKIKLTIVVNHTDLTTNRGTCFNQLLKEVGNFIGDWKMFEDSESISLAVTNFPNDIPEPKIETSIIQVLDGIASQVKDLGKFKSILEGITKRKAVAIFLQPSKIVTNAKQVYEASLEGETIEAEYAIPVDQPYAPKKKIGQVASITNTLEKTTRFLKKEANDDKIFTHNLQRDAQKIIEAVCDHLCVSVKKEAVDVINGYIDIYKDQVDENIIKIKKELTKLLGILNKYENVDELFDIMEIKEPKRREYNLLKTSLLEFSKISNLSNVNEKIWEVKIEIQSIIDQHLKIVAEKEAEISETAKKIAENNEANAKAETKRVERNLEQEKANSRDAEERHRKERAEDKANHAAQLALANKKEKNWLEKTVEFVGDVVEVTAKTAVTVGTGGAVNAFKK